MDLDYPSDPEDEAQQDAQQDIEVDGDQDVDDNGSEQDSNESGGDDGDEDSPGAPRSRSPSKSPEPPPVQTEGLRSNVPLLQAGACTCAYYDMVPVIAAPQATHVNAIVTTGSLRWFFTGGLDGYIRKYDFQQSITGKVPLTVAQKHPFVDSVQRSGVLISYWENEEPGVCSYTSDFDFLTLIDSTNFGPVSMTQDKTLSPVYCLAVQRNGLWLLSGLQSGSIKLQSVRLEESKKIAVLKEHTAAVSILKLSADERSVLSGGWDKNIFDWDLNQGQVKRSFAAGNDISGQVSTIVLRPEAASPIDWLRQLDRTPNDPALILPTAATAASPASTNSFDPLFDEEDEGSTADAEPVVRSEPPLMDQSMVSDHVVLSACIDGTMSLWDRRQSNAVARIPVPRGTPPWCMSACWSLDGEFYYAGRRNGTVDEYSVRGNMLQPSRTIKLPSNSGPVSALFPMPNGRSLVCASQDNIRLYDLKATSGIPFLIIPGHHGGVISSFYVDPTCRYAFSASGNRGWDGNSTEVLLGYEIGIPKGEGLAVL